MMKEILKNYKNLFETEMNIYFSEINTTPILKESVYYSISNGGKRIRPILCILGAELLGGSFADVKYLALAIEMIHSYSLVHDDLPSMDNDTLRRGKPTTHVKFGEGNAVLAGDALLNFAYETMLGEQNIDKNYTLAMKEIALCAGINGMIEGQSIDINDENKSGFAYEDFLNMYAKKTSCLLQGGLLSGAIRMGANSKQVTALRSFAYYIGIIFQIVDDILDFTSSEEILGKNINSDQDKMTFIAKIGLAEAKSVVASFEKKAIDALKIFGDGGNTLIQFCKYLTQRNY